MGGLRGEGDWVRDKGYYIHAKLRSRILKRSRVLNADDFLFFVFQMSLENTTKENFFTPVPTVGKYADEDDDTIDTSTEATDEEELAKENEYRPKVARLDMIE